MGKPGGIVSKDNLRKYTITSGATMDSPSSRRSWNNCVTTRCVTASACVMVPSRIDQPENNCLQRVGRDVDGADVRGQPIAVQHRGQILGGAPDLRLLRGSIAPHRDPR